MRDAVRACGDRIRLTHFAAWNFSELRQERTVRRIVL
jgi:hypothetical protein